MTDGSEATLPLSGATGLVRRAADTGLVHGAADAAGLVRGAAATLEASAVSAVVLAAGAGSRFGGGKMQAILDGRILPAHAAAAARAAGIARIVVVLGRDFAAVRRLLAAAGPILAVVNPAPERGLATSLRFGLAAAAAPAAPGEPAPAGVLVLLGDQPRVRPDVIGRLLAAAGEAPAGSIAVAPRYAGDPAPNPVLLLPAGYPLASAVDGDRGLGPLLAAAADRVVRVPVAGANPDVDTPADLAVVAAGAGRPR